MKVTALDRYGQVRWTPKSKIPPRPPSAVRDTNIPKQTTVPLTDGPDDYSGNGTPKQLRKGSERPKTGYIHKRGRVGKFDMPVHTQLQHCGFDVADGVVVTAAWFGGGPDFDTLVVTKLNHWNDLTTRLRGPHYLLMGEEQPALEEILSETSDEGFQYRSNSSAVWRFCLSAGGEPTTVAFDGGDYIAWSPKHRRVAGYQKFIVPITKAHDVVSFQMGATVVTDGADSEDVQRVLVNRISDDIMARMGPTDIVNMMGMAEVHESSPAHLLGDMLRMSLGAERVLSDL